MKITAIVILSVVWLLMVPLHFLGGHLVRAATINGLCINEREFTNISAMDLVAIRAWLNAKGGYLKGTNPDGTPFTFTDADVQPTNPAQEIFDSAILPYYDSGVTNQWLPGMNPQVLLTTLFKEKPTAFSITQRPSDGTLRNLGGVKPPSPSARDQIRKAGVQLRRNFHARLSQCSATNNSWQVDTARQTGEPNPGDERDAGGNPIATTPENKIVAALYSYTPWAGEKFGGGFKSGNPRIPGTGVGGNGLFCDLWSQFGWQVPPPNTPTVGPSTSPTLFCGNTTNKCLSLNVAGGTAPYNWVANKGSVTPSGNGRNVQLRPPQNPGSGLSGFAYVSKGDYTKNDLTNPPACNAYHRSGGARFGCNDQLMNYGDGTNCDGMINGGTTGRDVCWTPGNTACNLVIKTACGGPPCCQPNMYNPAGYYLSTNRGDGIIQSCHLNPNCNPCGLSMQGATVTVRDNGGNGTPVTVPVTLK